MEEVLSEERGGMYCCRFELIGEDMALQIVNAEIPRDGSYYSDDINKLFPDYVREEICGAQANGVAEELKNNALEQAKNYFAVY